VSDKKTEVTYEKKPHWLYDKWGETAETCKILLQMFIGFDIVILLGLKLFLQIVSFRQECVTKISPLTRDRGRESAASGGLQLGRLRARYEHPQ
jgi:hypothetical protein